LPGDAPRITGESKVKRSKFLTFAPVFMNHFIVIYFLVLILPLACVQENKPVKEEDTINSGTIRVSVDETLKPLMEAEFNIFSYLNPGANLVISYKPESKVMEDFKGDSARAIVITRELSSEESDYFKSIQYYPRSLPFAKDGISIILNKSNPCDSFTSDQLEGIFSGNTESKLIVVFDNNYSSTVRWLKDSLIKNRKFGKNCFSLENNMEVIQYVATHENALGIIGNSWISNRVDSTVDHLYSFIRRARISGRGRNEYSEPYQSDLASGLYPLSRMVYCIQRDGKMGLGTGLQRFLYDEKGQLIVLKFGLMPYTQPERSVKFKE